MSLQRYVFNFLITMYQSLVQRLDCYVICYDPLFIQFIQREYSLKYFRIINTLTWETPQNKTHKITNIRERDNDIHGSPQLGLHQPRIANLLLFSTKNNITIVQHFQYNISFLFSRRFFTFLKKRVEAPCSLSICNSRSTEIKLNKGLYS